MRRAFRILIVADYYLVGLLMLAAGALKVGKPGLGDILEYFLDREILPLGTVISFARGQPWFEMALGVAALTGWKAEWMARILGSLLIFFSLLILYVSEGYLLLPLDCGCFGGSGEFPAYLLIARNAVLAAPLFFFGRSHRSATLWSLLTVKEGP